MWPVKTPYSERIYHTEDDMSQTAMVRNECEKDLACWEVWVMFDGFTERTAAEAMAEKVAKRDVVVDEITDDMRKVIEWAWLNCDAPPEIHDMAARALNEPSLAHGFAT
jgi:hypothetical protein